MIARPDAQRLALTGTGGHGMFRRTWLAPGMLLHGGDVLRVGGGGDAKAQVVVAVVGMVPVAHGGAKVRSRVVPGPAPWEFMMMSMAIAKFFIRSVPDSG